VQHEASVMGLLVTVYLIVGVAVAECVYIGHYLFISQFHVVFIVFIDHTLVMTLT
jgi:hypothetical protein